MGEKIESTQLRVPENMMDYIRIKSDEMGVSQNSFILMLMTMGKKIFEMEAVIQIPKK